MLNNALKMKKDSLSNLPQFKSNQFELFTSYFILEAKMIY